MRVECPQCSTKHAVSEEKLELGELRLECGQCHAQLLVDESGNVSVAGAPGPPPEREAVHAEAPVVAHRSIDPSEGYATIPLPPLAELGLGPKLELGPPIVAPAGGVFAPPPPPPGSPPNPLAIPLPAETGAQGVTPPPPTARAIPDADLDDDAPLGVAVPLPPPPRAGLEPPRVNPQRSSTPPQAGPAERISSRPPASFDRAPARSSYLPEGVKTVTLSVPVPPVKPWGWGVLGGLCVLGCLLGALLAAEPNQDDLAPFDEASARRAMTDATGRALGCFVEGIPALDGRIELLLDQSGAVEEVSAQGPLAQSVRIDCVREHFEAIELEPFRGPPVRLSRRILIGAAEEAAR